MLFFWEKDENGKWIVKRHWLAAPGKEIEGAALQRRGGEESEFLAGAHGSSRQALLTSYEYLLRATDPGDLEGPVRQAGIDACEILERALFGVQDARERGPAGSPAPAMSDRPASPDEAEPEFMTCLVLALEMLKRGCAVIDMHPWGLRLQSPKNLEMWTIGAIPEHARARYRASLLPPVPVAVASAPEQPPLPDFTDDPNAPIDGAGEPIGRIDATDPPHGGAPSGRD